MRWRWRPATASRSRGGEVLASRGVRPRSRSDREGKREWRRGVGRGIGDVGSGLGFAPGGGLVGGSGWPVGPARRPGGLLGRSPAREGVPFTFFCFCFLFFFLFLFFCFVLF